MRKILITGITGQDGSYLADALLAKGCEVHGIIRPESIAQPSRQTNIRHLEGRITLHAGDITDQARLRAIIETVRPDDCYHLAASSFVNYSFEDEETVLRHNFNATHSLLFCLKELVPACRLYFAASSELFGNADTSPQNEQTRFNPRSMYGISKLAAYHLVQNFRKNHGMFACAGILYNHESPRRGFEFVTRKITSTVAKIHLGMENRLELGNLDARRDWGYAPEYVSAMQAMLARDTPDDFVIATGRLHSVREFLDIAFGAVGLNYTDYVHSNPKYFRADEGAPLCGDYGKAKKILGWEPRKPLAAIVEEMVQHDIALLKHTV